MKTIKYTKIILIVVMLFTSCKGIDDDTPFVDPLIGTWSVVSGSTTVENSSSIDVTSAYTEFSITFNPDATYSITSPNSIGSFVTETGTYEIGNENIRLSAHDDFINYSLRDNNSNLSFTTTFSSNKTVPITINFNNLKKE